MNANPADNLSYWEAIDCLVASHEVVIDRPRGSSHPRYPNDIYPLDYGFLKGTSSEDGDGIDLWLGSLNDRAAVGVIVTIDLLKRDSEVKILLGCSAAEMQVLLQRHNRGLQSAVLIERPVLQTATEIQQSETVRS